MIAASRSHRPPVPSTLSPNRLSPWVPHRNVIRIAMPTIRACVPIILMAGWLAALWCWAMDPANAKGPTLAQTLDWMDSTYNLHEGGSFGYGSVQLIDPNGHIDKSIDDTFSFIKCQITLTDRERWGPGKGEIDTTTAYTFNLANIDPSSLGSSDIDSAADGLACNLDPQDMICDTEETQFETTNDKPLIDVSTDEIFTNLTGKDHESAGNSKAFVTSFYFNDLGYAARFKAAFLHAIELCGGKHSTF